MKDNEVKDDIYESPEIPVSEVMENNKRVVEGKGVYKSISTSKKVVEYNKKIYLANDGKLYEISEDLTNSKVLAEDVDSFEINNDKLYSKNLYIDLKSGESKAVNNLIYVDADVLLLQPSDSTFNIISNKSNVIVNLENGEFLRKINDKLYFQQNMLESSSLYYMEIGDSSLNLINKEGREKLWENIDMESYIDENVSIEKIKRAFMEIDEITLVDNKIYYSYIVNDYDLSPMSIGAGGYDKKIVCLDVMGENKSIETISYSDGPAYHVSGSYLSEKMYSEDGVEEKEHYKIEFKEDCFVLIGDNGYGEIAKIMKSYPTNRGEKWSTGKVLDLGDVIYVPIETWGISGWRDYIEDKDHYFIRKDGFKTVEWEEGKLNDVECETTIQVLKSNKPYERINSNFGWVFINSIECYGDDYLVRGNVYDRYKLTKDEIERKISSNEPVYIENEACIILASDKNYFDYKIEGKSKVYYAGKYHYAENFNGQYYYIENYGSQWGDIWQLTDEKVEFLVSKDVEIEFYMHSIKIQDLYEEYMNKFVFPRLESFEVGEAIFWIGFEDGKCTGLSSVADGC